MSINSIVRILACVYSTAMKMVAGALVAIAVFATVLVMNLQGDQVRPSPEATVTRSDGDDVPTARPDSATTPAALPATPAEAPNQSAEVIAAPAAFELPASVHDFCARAESEECRQVEAFIDEMATEPRAAGWAADMESRIERAIGTELQGHAQVRALQCMRSRCAVVYALPADFGNLELGGDLTFGGALVQNAGVAVTETNATGNVIVSVLTWRCHGGSDCAQM